MTIFHIHRIARRRIQIKVEENYTTIGTGGGQRGPRVRFKIEVYRLLLAKKLENYQYSLGLRIVYDLINNFLKFTSTLHPY